MGRSTCNTIVHEITNFDLLKEVIILKPSLGLDRRFLICVLRRSIRSIENRIKRGCRAPGTQRAGGELVGTEQVRVIQRIAAGIFSVRTIIFEYKI